MIFENEEYKRSNELLRSFCNIQQNIMRHIQKTANNNGLSIPQFSVLMTVSQCDEITQKTIKDKTLLPKSTLSQAIEGLVQLDILERRQIEGNRREIQLIVSNKGKSLIKELHLQKSGIHQLFHNAVNSLTEKEFQQQLHVHQQITSYFEKHEDDNRC